MQRQALAGLIDHTLLKPESTAEQVAQLCAEARQENFCSVCVLPFYVPVAAEQLRHSAVKLCTVIGFPLGAHAAEAKAREARIAVEQGADELDMVLNVAALKSGQYDFLHTDVAAVVAAARGRLVKVILETCLLNIEEKVIACKAAVAAGAAFVKTSTGFSTGGATLDDVRLMRATVGAEIGVKASGGIRSYETACAMVAAGANRLGTSAGLLIVGAAMQDAGDRHGDGY